MIRFHLFLPTAHVTILSPGSLAQACLNGVAHLSHLLHRGWVSTTKAFSGLHSTLIDRAAQSSGKTRTDFILEAARRAAEEALLDRAVTAVSSRGHAAFLARLDAPAQPNERLRRTMQTPPPWAKG